MTLHKDTKTINNIYLDIVGIDVKYASVNDIKADFNVTTPFPALGDRLDIVVPQS